MLETFKMAVVAAAVGCAVALPVAFLASRVTAPNRFVLTTDRSVLSVIRAIPDILYALVFVAAVGIGPLPGIAALVFFNVGVVAKLLSETVDGVDTGRPRPRERAARREPRPCAGRCFRRCCRATSPTRSTRSS